MYKFHLILKYLRKRRIAWVSLVAVTLCTTMVLVVISVMGGWLEMFSNNARGLVGDVLVRAQSLSGFQYYEEMAEKIDQLDGVQAAVPTIQTYGLVRFGHPEIPGIKKTLGVQVIGVPIDRIGQVNKLPQSFYRQYESYVDRKETPPPPSFDLHKATTLPFPPPPEALAEPVSGKVVIDDPDLKAKLHYDPRRGTLTFDGPMSDAEAQKLKAVEPDNPLYKAAVERLYRATHFPGLIAGSGLLEIHKDHKGNVVGREPFKYEMTATLTAMGIPADNRRPDLKSDVASATFWVVDDSHTGMWQYDTNTVYVDFDVLQQYLGMKSTNPVEPSRCSEIHVKLKPGRDLNAARDTIAGVVEEVEKAHRPPDVVFTSDEPLVETWEQSQALFLNAINNEKLLVTILFGIISLVAVFLIFCIFYMIVVEKTRDVGIIKSVGATSAGVAGIFLGYGLAIGLIGTALGLLVSYGIVHNINYLHTKMGELLHVQIWNPEVYAFDTIPNTMDPTTVVVIACIAVVSCVVGALVPAIRAASLNPVEALRWE